MRALFIIFFGGLFALTIPGTADAEARLRAVLVGVGDYLHLEADLKGPPNDVALMADMLQRRGVAHDDIVQITDGADLLPDRLTILTALQQTVANSAVGDTVLIYFSGHGSQAPDLNGDEQGGYDEIFLPRDAKAWNGAKGMVENAILDDDFAAIAAQAAQGGVKLIAIMDACHSATGFRALDQGAGRARYIDPAELGIPEQATQSSAVPSDPSGAFVYLYAAQSDQRAFEYPASENPDLWYGDFTLNLVNVLNDVADLSYDQLAQAVALRIRSTSGQAAQTPEIEGTMTQEPVFGGDAPALRRIALTGYTLHAGSLQGVTVGSTVALYADVLANQPLAQATVSAVRPTESDLEISALPAVRLTHGEITNRAPDVTVSIGFSAEAAKQLDHLVPGGLAELQKSLDFRLALQNAQYSVVWTGRSFALVGRDGVLDGHGPGTSPRLAFPAETADLISALAIALDRSAHRIRIELALAQVVSGQKPATFALIKTAPDVTYTRVAGNERAGRCRLDQSAKADVAGTATAAHCDALELNITNPTSKMQDVTVLYIDADNRIDMLWPTSNLSNRIPTGETRTLRFGLRNDARAGQVARESLIVLSVPAKPGSSRTVFAGLVGHGTDRGATGEMDSYLAGLTSPDAKSRGFSLTPKGQALNMSRLDLSIAPARPAP